MPVFSLLVLLFLTLSNSRILNSVVVEDFPHVTPPVLGQSETRSSADSKQNEDSKDDESEIGKGPEDENETSEKSTESSGEARSTVEINGVKKEIQVESTGGKIKIKKEDDGRVQTEIESPRAKVKFTFEGGRLRTEVESEDGKEVEAQSSASAVARVKVKSVLDDLDLQIATGSSGPLLKGKSAEALSSFPLSVDLQTRALTVTTPAGQKTVTILPDQAVANMLSKNVFSRVEEKGSLKLEERKGELVYRIAGQKQKKLVGLFNVEPQATAFVSAQNGELLAKEQNLLNKIIDLLSF